MRLSGIRNTLNRLIPFIITQHEFPCTDSHTVHCAGNDLYFVHTHTHIRILLFPLLFFFNSILVPFIGQIPQSAYYNLKRLRTFMHYTPYTHTSIKLFSKLPIKTYEWSQLSCTRSREKNLMILYFPHFGKRRPACKVNQSCIGQIENACNLIQLNSN